MSHRTIVLAGSIDEGSVANFMREFTELDSTPGPIEIRIFSGGGSSTGGMAIYDMLRNSNNHVTTVALGDVSSIAILIFQGGDRRVVSKNCSFLFHPHSAHAEGTTEEMASMARETARLQARYCRILSARSGLPYKAVQKLCSKASFRNAKEVLRMGFADYTLGTPAETKSRIVMRDLTPEEEKDVESAGEK